MLALDVLILLFILVNEDGPPAWVNFGKKIITNISQQGFKSLENKSKENKEDVEFQTQRQDAISEATQGAVKKVFGGGVKAPITFSSNSNNNSNVNQNTSNRASNKQTRKQQAKEKIEVEKQEKPSQKVSLFDFLENKLPVSETTPKTTTNVKVYNEDYKNSETNKFNKPPNKYDVSSKSGPSNRYQTNREFRNDKQNYEYRPPNRNDQRNKYPTDRNDVRQQYQNEKPPRFQKQKQDNSKYPTNSPLDIPRPEMSNQKYQNTTKEYRSKPDTNNFINKLANEINSISLYNSKYEHEKLNRPQQNNMIPQQNHQLPQNHTIPQQNHNIQQQNHSIQQQNSMIQQNSVWKWKTGDRCMAKYWEDNKVSFYNINKINHNEKFFLVLQRCCNRSHK